MSPPANAGLRFRGSVNNTTEADTPGWPATQTSTSAQCGCPRNACGLALAP